MGSVEVFEHRIAQATAILERIVLEMKSASGSALAPIATSDSSDGTDDEIEGGSPEYQLATGLRVDADQRGFVWMAIAIATEPRCAILAALAFWSGCQAWPEHHQLCAGVSNVGAASPALT